MPPAKRRTAAPRPIETMTELPPPARQESAGLTVDRIVAIIGGADDVEAAAELNRVLYRFGAQDPSRELPRSWQRVQRRLGVTQPDGVATAEQVRDFAARAGLSVKDADTM